MSFAFLPLYTGDYLRDTQHLSCAEHGIYLKLIIHSWDQRGPVPLDERKQLGIVNARSSDEIEALRRVLGEFFIRMEDGWYNKRIQVEIERSNSISHARSNAGKKGYQAKAKQLLSKSQASASTPTPTPTTISTPTTKKQPRSRSSAPAFCLPDWIPSAQWDAYEEMRKKIKKPMTDFARQMAVSQLEELKEQGHHPAAVLAQSVFKSWQGLFEVK